ncbi:isoleucyl-tRNA synthase [Sulfolobus acidocaldarius SUSAZ]|nr:isoleucyl-tRNA synthase [Sulfolobus acidocaldarius SUSAZ]
MTSKFDPLKFEEEVLKYWDDNKIYKKLKEINEKNHKKFLFIDGPPYPSSPIPHIGTVWNKTIKDCILRYERLMGYSVKDQPGYDTHGLPIEVETEKRLGIKSKAEIIEKIGVDNFISKCKEFAINNSKSLTQNFRNLGIFMDWENPYFTFNNDYISNSWAVIKKAYERGLLYKGVHVLHWCSRCETTLADYEVSEYRDLEDPSIYVKFRVKGEPNRYLVIWTTTPWTLPANVFVMVNKDFEYADVRVGDEILVIAKDRVKELMKEARIKEYKILRVYKGEELIGLEYEHPLADIVNAQSKINNHHKVLDGGEAVTLQEGTGLVHSAPGHGDIDFEIGKKYDMPVVMLVNDKGEFTQDSGKYAGKYVRSASEEIISDLKQRNALVYASKIVHRYPVCWRCKTPLILRAIEQWFIAVSKLKDNLMGEIDRVRWIPDWGKTRIGNMVKEVRDWVISRQRFWGIPLPIWVCSNCENIIVVGGVDELNKISINQVPQDLHRPWIDSVVVRCEKCGGEARRISDVADVWFDSGVAFFASLGKDWRKKWSELGPVDLVLEGHDQLRGWFFSLLRTGVILMDRAPYEAVLVHGFMLDEQGKEMHKSSGNYVEPSQVVSKYGRDTLRLWLLRNTTWEDAKFSWKSLDMTRRDLNIIWNVYVFANTYMSLDEFKYSKYSYQDIKDYLKLEDIWLLSRYYRMLKEVTEAMKEYKVHELANKVTTFIIDDISRFYLRVTRKRAWNEANDPDKIAMYYVLYHVLKGSLILLSTVIPFAAEKIYLDFVQERLESISMEKIPEIKEEFINEEIEEAFEIAKEIIDAGLNARAKAGIKLRWPLKEVYVFLVSDKDRRSIEKITDVLSSLLNSKSIIIEGIDGYKRFSKIRATPNTGSIGPTFKRLSVKVAEYIQNNSDKVAQDIVSKGYHEFNVDSENLRLDISHVNLVEEVEKGYASARFSKGVVLLKQEMSKEEEEEGIIRDLIRRIQFMRKQLSLNVNEYILLSIRAPNDKVDLIKKWEQYIKNETRAKELRIGDVSGDLIQDWDVEEETYTIGVSKADVSVS